MDYHCKVIIDKINTYMVPDGFSKGTMRWEKVYISHDYQIFRCYSKSDIKEVIKCGGKHISELNYNDYSTMDFEKLLGIFEFIVRISNRQM